MDCDYVSESEYLFWVARQPEVFAVARAKLLAREGPLADRLLVKRVESDDGRIETIYLGNPEFARAAAWEDLDCKVSRGFFAVDAAGKAVETRRALDPLRFAPARWLGPEAFHALFRRVLRAHCVREILDFLPSFLPPDGGVEGSVDPDDCALGNADAVRHLSRFQELLLRSGRRRVAETAGAVVRHLQEPGILLSDWQHDSFWESVGVILGVRGNSLAQRKHRYLSSLIELREDLPDWLEMRASCMLATEAEAVMEDLLGLRSRVGGPFVEAVLDYYMAFLAKQHPVYADKSLDELRGVAIAKLVRRHGRPDVSSWPPAGDDFDAFCRVHGLNVGDPRREALEWLGLVTRLDPLPKRVLAALVVTFATGSALGGEEGAAYVE